MVIFNSLQSVLSIILMLSMGCFFTYKGWFDNGTSKLFSKIVINIAVPCYMISSLMGTYDKEKLLRLASGVFASTLSISNTLFVGLPVNIALFGDSSIPFVFIYFLANITLFWTIGNFGINKDGGQSGGSIFSFENLKMLLSPPLCGFVIAIILIFMKVTLPKFIMDTFKYMGSMTTLATLLFIPIYIILLNKI